MKFFVDLNSDIGEGYGAYKLGMDEEIMKCVTSVNCACGWHAGDPLIMTKQLKLQKIIMLLLVLTLDIQTC